jgi:hypothetical protein
MADLVEPDPSLAVYCDACEARICPAHGRLDCAQCSHQARGEAVKPFEPAGPVIPGQLSF